jgi:hypothetical protein
MDSRIHKLLILLTLIGCAQLTGCIIIDAEGDWEEVEGHDGAVRKIVASGSSTIEITQCGCDRTEVWVQDGGGGVIHNGGSLVISGSNDIRVRTPSLERIIISGSPHITLTGFNGPSLEITSSGSGELELSGRTDRLELKLSGSAKIDASRLEARDVRVVASGSSDIVFCATRDVDVTSSGSGDVISRCAR